MPSTNGDYRPIVGNMSYGCGGSDGQGICGGYGLGVYQDNAGFKNILGWIGFGVDDAQSFVVDWVPSPNTWYMLSMVWDETSHTLRFYVNGVQQGSNLTRTGVAMVPASNQLALGVDLLNGQPFNDYFDGKIDETGIWNSAFSADQIAALYNSGNGKQYPF